LPKAIDAQHQTYNYYTGYQLCTEDASYAGKLYHACCWALEETLQSPLPWTHSLPLPSLEKTEIRFSLESHLVTSSGKTAAAQLTRKSLYSQFAERQGNRNKKKSHHRHQRGRQRNNLLARFYFWATKCI